MNQNPYSGARRFFGYALLMFAFGTFGWTLLTLRVADEPATQSFYTVVRVLDIAIAVIFLLMLFAEGSYKPTDPKGAKEPVEDRQEVLKVETPVEGRPQALTMETLMQQERSRDLRARAARTQKGIGDYSV